MLFLIYGMIAVGLNVLVGLTGLVSLGQAGLFALGSYTGAILATRLGFDIVASCIGAAIVSGCIRRAAGLSDGARSRRLSRRRHDRVRHHRRERRHRMAIADRRHHGSHLNSAAKCVRHQAVGICLLRRSCGHAVCLHAADPQSENIALRPHHARGLAKRDGVARARHQSDRHADDWPSSYRP